MMNPKDARMQKIMEVLEQVSLNENQLTQLEAYLSGEAGEEVLETLGFEDLSKVPSDKFVRLFRELVNKGRKEEAGRLFNIVFAIGQSTCYSFVPIDMITQNQGITTDAAKKAAVYAAMLGMNQYGLHHGIVIKTLIDIADKKPENLKTAIAYQKHELDNGKLVLLAAYFLAKYPNVVMEVPVGEDNQNKGFLSGVGKLFGKKTEKAEQNILVGKEDMELMQEYEDITVNSLGNLFQNQMRQADLQTLIYDIDHNRISENTLQLVRAQNTVSRFLLKLLGGMAYLNYQLSMRLRNVVMVCLAVSVDEMLNIMEAISSNLRTDIRVDGRNYDKVFGIDSSKYICWAALKGHKNILEAQFEQNRESFLAVMETVDMGASNRMLSVIREKDQSLYREMQKNGHNKDKEKLIQMLLPKNQSADAVRAYLRGEEEIASLYPYEEEIGEKYYYGGSKERTLLQDYRKNYNDGAFFRRCQVFMLFKRAGYFFREDMVKKSNIDAQLVKKLFHAFDAEKLDLIHQVNAVIMLYDTLYIDRWKKVFLDAVREVFDEYLKERREETITAFSKAEAFGRYFGLSVMRKNVQENKAEILSYSQDSAKVVKEELLSILYEQKNWEQEVMALLSSKKAAERELAIRVLLHWDESKYAQDFAGMLEKEKNAKVRSLLETALKLEDAGARSLTQEDLVKELHKGGKKRSLAWAYETPFSVVHRENGDVADEEYLQAILLCYASADGCGVSKKADELAQALKPSELARYVNELFDKWMDAGAEARKRWVLYAAAIHGGPDIVKKLQHQIQEWPQHARGAIAAEAVQALALNPLPQALLIVDSIARKFKFKQVKAAAGKALEFAAAQLGLSREELADKIVPDLGFDENMERSFDYGERQFKVTITPALEIEVFDETGKKLKNMPAPGKKDDAEKAAAAYEAFKQMKKQMKTTVSSQKMRLEMALSTEREWSVEAWKNLFVKNPIMHQFAIGLIWGLYEERRLIKSFRYMEDGSFNTEEEEEYELPQSGQIGLVHPIELSAEAREAWKQQMEDYEIIQPIEQLDRPIYHMTEEEAGMRNLERFGGCILNDLSLGGKLLGFGWYRGTVEDAGGFYTYYREDAELMLGVELHFSGSFVGGENEDVTVYDARFYQAGQKTTENTYYLRDIPARYFSEIVLQLTKATASSKEKNENWRKDA